MGAVLYLVILKSVWTMGYPTDRLLLFDGVTVIFKDVLPMFLILYFTAKRSYSTAPTPTAVSRTSASSQMSMTSFLSSLPGSTAGTSIGGTSIAGTSITGASRHSYTRIGNADDNGP